MENARQLERERHTGLFTARIGMLLKGKQQCSGSITFWGGSGSGDPCLWLMDPDPESDPDPAIFVIDLQDASKKLNFNTIFSAYYFLKVHLHHFSKIKSQKESQNSRNQGFSYNFCIMIEGSGSIPLTSGSGSGRPKNMWIRIRVGSGTLVSSEENLPRSRWCAGRGLTVARGRGRLPDW